MKIDQKLNILFVEDLPADAELAQRELKKENLEFSSCVVDTEKAFRAALNEHKPDIVISDYSMPTFDGMSALKITREQSEHIPFIMLTGSINEETAVSCMKAGANDYVLKEQITRLPFAVMEAIHRDRERIKKEIAEEKLRESEARYRSYINNSPNGIFVMDMEGRFLDVNPMACELTGYTADQLLNMKIYDLNSTDNGVRFSESMIMELKQKEKLILQMPYRKKDGVICWWQINAIMINTRSALAFTTDISNLKKAEKDLISKNAFITTVLDNLPIGVALNEIDDGNATYINKKFQEIYGWPEDKLKNIKKFFEYVYPDPEYRKKVSERIARDIETKDPKRMHWENIRVTQKNGGQRIVNAINIPLFDQNVMVSTVMDMTKQRKAEEELIHALEKAKESDRLKSAFLANMSHEIRTPMNGILGFSGLLKHSDLNTDKQQEYIDIIQQSGKRMLNTINDLIDISRIESGQVIIKEQSVNFNEQLDRLYQFFLPEAKGKGLELTCDLPLENKEALITTDEEKFFSIMNNYLKNAIKYTEEGYVHFGYELNKGNIAFFVRDSGIGIPQDKLDAVFERFVQADLSLSKPYEGSGLGLSISKAYAEMIGGKVRVESRFGKGSAFYLELPFDSGEKGKPARKEQNTDMISNNKYLNDLSILVVEDDEASVLYMEILLKDKCSELKIAKNGSDAINMIKKHPEIDLILMDVRMPDMDGYSATRKIRKFNPDVIIIAQTAFAMESDRIKSIDAGCDGYISKPIREEDLLSTIQELIKKRNRTAN